VNPSDPVTNNGSDAAPGIITCPTTRACVNVRVLLDSEGAPVGWACAEEAVVGHSCYWPPGV
jgi:hypothetical protein